MSALDEIAAERRRQVEAEGWTAEHDDGHTLGEMAQAAACYASASFFASNGWKPNRVPQLMMWPWDILWWKPTDRRRDLIKAAALIVAEIERLDRVATREHAP
jgi:hypothetical protein